MDTPSIIFVFAAIVVALAVLGSAILYIFKTEKVEAVADDSSYFEKDDELFTAVDIRVISRLQPAYLKQEQRTFSENFE
ncbi:hypothetical protein HDV06_002044 [Boothiomyces sp. JEL0866]|nr:hypothetical protein HDV06_002044 [Boothiomyces sp. JEL0866]